MIGCTLEESFAGFLHALGVTLQKHDHRRVIVGRRQRRRM